jgi:hypothetical protein
MLPGSRVLTAAEFEQQRHALKHATAICYCTVGYRCASNAAACMRTSIATRNTMRGAAASAAAQHTRVCLLRARAVPGAGPASLQKA